MFFCAGRPKSSDFTGIGGIVSRIGFRVIKDEKSAAHCCAADR